MGRRSMEISDVVVVDDGRIRSDEAPTETTDPDEHTMPVEAAGAETMATLRALISWAFGTRERNMRGR